MNSTWVIKVGCFFILSGVLLSCTPPSVSSSEYDWHLPEGFPSPLVPKDNPMSEAKVALGKQLFFDLRLSFNQSMSCASCHQPEFAFSEPKKTAVGATGQNHRRNTQSLVNVAYNSNLTWAHSGLNKIEQQILIPMFSEDPIELGITGHEKTILQRFVTPDYAKLFEHAFNDSEVNFDRIVKALASYVRSLTSFASAFDEYAYQNNDNAMSDAAKRGMELFFSETFECFHCHGGFNFTQSSQHQNQRLDLRPFHNTGLYKVDDQGAYPVNDQGLIEVTLQPQDMGKFRAPTLRNVEVSAPYMHDGSLATLGEVIDFYAAGGRGQGVTNPLKSPFLAGFALQQQQKQDLIAFLQSLTDYQFLNSSVNIPSESP
ncbi:MbnH family di-heme enzyme [uncultured Paraglaciecola sp.]|uniref:MbnH family di-heme enzyme n=1 Tax=uncultured Paraglaciecola sp. TaxID=1765024 RepID=UPI0030DA9063|tara:strand:+ start:17161 stop:18276 length:1116 start_codon:yes stop_codon:yes gene_type:complete